MTSNKIKVGTEILNYTITAAKRQTKTYQWWEARDRDTNRTVVLQLPQPDISDGEIHRISEHFDKLRFLNESSSKFLIPDDITSASGLPLVLVYKSWPEISLREAIERSPQQATGWWQQAIAELLGTLHRKGIVHGNPSLDSFFVVDGRPVLGGFGYAPLLDSNIKNPGAIADCKGNLAPEVPYLGVTPQSDIYTSGEAIARSNADIKKSTWYRQATHPDPDERFQKWSQAANGLIGAFNGSDRVSDDLPKPRGKCFVTANSRPPEGGKVDIQGNGAYKQGDSVTVRAIAADGWEFVSWKGDAKGNDPTIALEMNGNKTLSAQFRELASAGGSVPVSSSKKRRSVAKIAVAAVAIVLLGGGAVVASQSRRITALCRPQGNCLQYEKALDRATAIATEAEELESNAETIADLETVRDRFSEAVLALENIPDNASNFEEVEAARGNYQNQIEELGTRIETERQAAEKLQEIEENATTASEKMTAAETIAAYEEAKALWKAAIADLENISGDTFVAETVATRSQEYEEEIEAIDKEIAELEAAAQPVYQPAPQPNYQPAPQPAYEEPYYPPQPAPQPAYEEPYYPPEPAYEEPYYPPEPAYEEPYYPPEPAPQPAGPPLWGPGSEPPKNNGGGGQPLW